MDAKSIIELIAAGALLPYLCWLVWRLLVKQQNSLDDERKRATETTQQMASIIAKVTERIDRVEESHDLMRQELELMRQTLVETSKAKQVAIEQNTAAEITNREIINTLKAEIVQSRTDFKEAMALMDGAGRKLVNDVNIHTDTALAPLGTAISEGRAENLTAHTSQAESVEKQMSDLRDLMAQNGKDTRAKIDDVLKKLDGISVTIADLKTTLTAQGVDAGKFAERLNQIGLDVDNIKKELQQPAAPAPSLPPVDPLANLPPKSEEMK